MNRKQFYAIASVTCLLFTILFACKNAEESPRESSVTVRVASYNLALASANPGDVMSQLKNNSQRIRNIANIIQIVNPDILFVQELQYDKEGEHIRLFKENYLEVGQNGAEAIEFAYSYHFPSNAGHLTGYDLNKDGDKAGPYDAHGWGTFPNQFALAIFSKYPIDFENIRTFKNLKWKDMPNAHRPFEPETGEYYWSDEAWESIYISSKNHVDVPVIVGNDTIHILGMHAQGEAGDGSELRNTMKNFDEIKFFTDYINGHPFIDDKEITKSFNNNNPFVITGDFNSSPALRGRINDLAIEQLLNHPSLNKEVTWGKHVPTSNGALECGNGTQNNPLLKQSTAPVNFGQKGVRIDYVLPSKNLEVFNSGVFWPASNEKHYKLVESKETGSDHRLVYVDIKL